MTNIQCLILCIYTCLSQSIG